MERTRAPWLSIRTCKEGLCGDQVGDEVLELLNKGIDQSGIDGWEWIS